MEGALQDDLKWFGEGFDGFPKRLPESTVEYAIYVLDTKLSDAQVRSRSNAILQAAIEFNKKLLKDYIWQREGFNLKLQRQDGEKIAASMLRLLLQEVLLGYLRIQYYTGCTKTTRESKEAESSPPTKWALVGRVDHGDSLDDEWLIVYLLRALSNNFQEAWIRVYDTDGEFLLIEAANALPRWLNPEIAENRVWLHEGKIKIIPLKPPGSSSANRAVDSKFLSLNQALHFLRTSPGDLIYSPGIQEEAFHRIRDHPRAISDIFHHSLVRVPRNLAHLLHRRPRLISPAIEAFYLRDPISMRSLHSADATSEKLHFPPTDFVNVSIKFTKVGFAQLKSQRYVAPAFWEATLPKKSPLKTLSQSEIGMKLACGFEMLVSDPQNKSKLPVREIQLLLKDLEDGDEELPTDAEIATWPKKEDSEEWLDIDFSTFENTLAGGGKKESAAGLPKGHTGFGDPMAQENLRKMVERFEAFLKDDEAGADGAGFLDDMDFDDDDDDKEEGDAEPDGEENQDVDFDEEKFAKMLKEMLGMSGEATNIKPKNAKQTTAGAEVAKKARFEELDDSDEEDEAAAVEKQMRLMEEELRGHGALNLNPPAPATLTENSKGKQIMDKGEADTESVKGKDKVEDKEDDDVDQDGEVNIDYNLMKNMLEAFKGQAGMGGPAGNMMGMMGIQMPRDEDEEEGGPSK